MPIMRTCLAGLLILAINFSTPTLCQELSDEAPQTEGQRAGRGEPTQDEESPRASLREIDNDDVEFGFSHWTTQVEFSPRAKRVIQAIREDRLNTTECEKSLGSINKSAALHCILLESSGVLSDSKGFGNVCGLLGGKHDENAATASLLLALWRGVFDYSKEKVGDHSQPPRNEVVRKVFVDCWERSRDRMDCCMEGFHDDGDRYRQRIAWIGGFTTGLTEPPSNETKTLSETASNLRSAQYGALRVGKRKGAMITIGLEEHCVLFRAMGSRNPLCLERLGDCGLARGEFDELHVETNGDDQDFASKPLDTKQIAKRDGVLIRRFWACVANEARLLAQDQEIKTSNQTFRKAFDRLLERSDVALGSLVPEDRLEPMVFRQMMAWVIGYGDGRP